MNAEAGNTGAWIKSSAKAILKGRFLIHIQVGKYLIHILYVFVLFTIVIWVSMMIDLTLAKVERNNKKLDELEIVWSDMNFREAKATSRKAVGENLKKLGSEVAEPLKPATVINDGRQ